MKKYENNDLIINSKWLEGFNQICITQSANIIFIEKIVSTFEILKNKNRQGKLTQN